MNKPKGLPRRAVIVGKLHRKLGNWDIAAAQFLRAAESASEDAALWEAAARALEFSDGPGVLEAYGKAAKLGGMSADSWYRYGRLLEANLVYADALHAFERAADQGKAPARMAFRRGRCLTHLGRPVQAATEFRAALAGGFDARAAFCALEGLLEASTPLWIQTDLYREGQPWFDGTDDWTATHAALAAKMGFASEAVEMYRLVAGVRDLEPEEAVEYAEALDELGNCNQARVVLEQALRPHDASVGIGALYFGVRKWSKAREAFLVEERRRGLDAELAGRIAMTFDREYRWADAAGYFERAYRLDPSDSQAAYKCGHAYERIEDFQSAAFWYAEALRLQPHKFHWWYRFGTVLYKSGEVDRALAALRRSVKVAESSNTERNPIDNISYSGGRNLNSVREDWARAACSEGPWVVRDAPGMTMLAKMALEVGLTEEAAFLASSAIEKSQGMAQTDRLELSTVLEGLARSDDAVEVLLGSRTVRLSDGVDLGVYLPSGVGRAERQYAEFTAEFSVRDNAIMFEANHGASAACHPLALYREMRRDSRFEGMRLIWALKRPDLAPAEILRDPRVSVVTIGSDSYLYHLATAGFLVNNVSFPPYFARRAEQRYLNTWHGTPMKTLGRSMKQGLLEYENLERNFLQASHLLAPNDLTKWALLTEHHLDGIYPGSVGVLGSPRLDRLVRDRESLRAEIRSRLGVRERERLVLVAPTWRGGVSSHDLDAGALLAQLEAVARVEGVRVFYRAHRLTEKLVMGMKLPVEVVPADIDTNDLLAAVDHLVSDYSSIIFDFLVTGNPITLYVPDIDDYRAMRGLYVEPDELPVGVAHTLGELVSEIESGGSVPPESYAEAVHNYCPREDGYAASRCLDFFMSDELRGQELNNKPTLLFHASMIPNGIASALLAILEELVQLDVNVVLLVEPAVLRERQDRASIFARVPEGVRLVSRVGGTTMTPEEFYIRGVVESRLASPGPEMNRTYRDSWMLEARRIVGEMPITAAIEWDGYATLWAGILSSVGQEETRRLIWQHNEMEEEESRKYPELAAVFNLYPLFDAAVSVSELLGEKNRHFVTRREVAPKEGVIPVRNALTFEKVRRLAKEPVTFEPAERLARASHTVLSVGRLSMEKNHEALIQSWPGVLQQFPGAQLIIVGSGPLQAQLSSLVHKLGLSESVLLAGQLENPYPLMQNADLFVLPSLHEGQPIVLFEAMSLGTAIAASSCPGNVEALSLGYGRALAEGENGIRDSIVEALRNPSDFRGPFDVGGHEKASVDGFLQAVLPDLAKEQLRH